MRSTAHTLLALAVFASPALPAATQPPEAEEALETMSTLLSAPTAIGALAARACAACPERRLNLTERSRFYAADQELSFDAFRRMLSGPDARFVSVYFRDADKTVTRIVVGAP